jgi:hypothetical protein
MPEDMHVAARLQRALEPYQSMVYGAAEAETEYGAIGLDPGRMGYFASRSAPMGAVSAATVTATFYNFSPDLINTVIPRAWSLASVDDIIAARWRVADTALRRVLGNRIDSPEVAQAAALVRRATDGLPVSGRPLFAGHTELTWPDEPHLAVWLGSCLLREFRGDGHLIALAAAGVGGIEALITHTATRRGFTDTAAQGGRGWTDELWTAAVDGLRTRGILTAAPELTLTPAGTQLRADIEAETNRLAEQPWQQLGGDDTETLRILFTDLSWAVVDAGAIDQRAFALPRTPQDAGERVAP